jgi:lipopolysaccharide cholinephosphotransferase
MKSQYLTPTTLKNLQIELLKLLKIIDSVCKENNIEYWLIGGTLLGAVRHKGFIPWDDDIDINVPAEDYHRLIAALNTESKTNKNIFLYFEHNDVPKFTLERFASTKIIMQRGRQTLACFLDIEPARIIKRSDKNHDTNILKTAEYFIFGRALDDTKIDKKYLKNTLKSAIKAKKKFTKYFHSDYLPTCNHKGLESIVSSGASYFPYQDIFPLQSITFEGFKTFAPNNLKGYLRVTYGKKYMSIPSRSQRTTRHSHELYFCNSNKFAIESTAKAVTKGVSSFYRNPVRRFIKNLINNIGIYEKMKQWEKEKRIRRYAKKNTH